MQFLLAGCSIIFTTFPVITGLCMMKARIMWLEVGDPRLAQSCFFSSRSCVSSGHYYVGFRKSLFIDRNWSQSKKTANVFAAKLILYTSYII